MMPDPAIPPTEAATTPGVPSEPQEETVGQPEESAESARQRSQTPDAPLASTLTHLGPPTYAPRGRLGAVPQAPGYRMLRELGRGTYGEVWLAEAEHTNSQVAIKFFTGSMGEQWQLLQAEVKQLAAFHDDPGIVQLMAFDAGAQRPYYVMAYAEGGSLALRLREGPLPLAAALSMFRRIAEAMAYVHAKGIRHCDLKPGNILIDKRGRPRVADFGQAHLAGDLSPALGTFFYMAPEQADLTAQEPDARWDVYGLGALLYAMLTGDPPYDDSTLKQELAKTENAPHRLRIYREAMARAKPLTAHREVAGMDKPLAAIIERCLAVDPARRYRNAEAVVAALDKRLRSRRHKSILYGGLVVPVLLLVILGGLGWWEASRALEASEAMLQDEAMKSYTNCARLAAVKVKDNLEHYIKGLVFAAQDEALKKALNDPALQNKPKDNNNPIKGCIKRFWDDNHPPLNLAPNPVIYWCVLDSKGILLCVRTRDKGFDQDYLGCDFSWRGYFNGGFDDPEALEAFGKWNALRQSGKGDGRPFRWEKTQPPIAKMTNISDPFKIASGSPAIALSTPVRDENDGILGVLMVALDLNAFSSWLRTIDFADDGFPVLINEDTHVLVHNNPKLELVDWGKSGKTPKKYGSECPLYESIVNEANMAKNKNGGSGRLTDPLLHDDYLAGYVAIEFKEPQSRTTLEQRWGLLVQVKKATVLEPARILKRDTIRWGAIMLTVAILMVVGMWFGLLWMLRREERLA